MQNFRRVGLLVTMLLVGGLVGCGEKEECESDVTCGRSFEVCCKGEDCNIKVGSQTFRCASATNCDSAIVQAAFALCANSPDEAKAALQRSAAQALAGSRSFAE